MKMHEKLKPCPFCGCTQIRTRLFAENEHGRKIIACEIDCPDCGIYKSGWEESGACLEEIIKLVDKVSAEWNRRADNG